MAEVTFEGDSIRAAGVKTPPIGWRYQKIEIFFLPPRELLSKELLEPLQAGLVIVEIILPGMKAELFAGGDVVGQIVQIDRFRGVELVIVDGSVIEFGIWFCGSYFLGKVMVVEEGEVWVACQEIGGVDSIGVGKQDESMIVGVELLDDFPHRVVEGKNVLPGFGEDFGRDVVPKKSCRAGYEFLIVDCTNFNLVHEILEVGGNGSIWCSEDLLIEILEMEFEKNVSDVEEEGHCEGSLERINWAASLAAEGLE